MNNSLTVAEASGITLFDMRADSQKFPRLNTYKREEAVVLMSRIISQAFLYKGQSADLNNIQFIASALVDELQSDDEGIGTKYLSFAEISRLIKRAILQEEIYVSVSSIYKVLTEYAKGEGHLYQKRLAEGERPEMDAKKKKLIQQYAMALVKASKI